MQFSPFALFLVSIQDNRPILPILHPQILHTAVKTTTLHSRNSLSAYTFMGTVPINSNIDIFSIWCLKSMKVVPSSVKS